jgi:DNA-binding NarL/FixJ family response regulator
VVDVVVTDAANASLSESHAHRIREARRLWPQARILVVEVGDELDVERLTDSRVYGYFREGDLFDSDQIIAAVRAVASGLFVTPLARLLDDQSPWRRRALVDEYHLSRAEAEILDLVISGLTNKAIAARTHYAPQTVKNMVSSCFRKLGVHTRLEAARVVREGRAVTGAGRRSMPG